MSLIVRILKKLVFAIFLIFTYNKLSLPLNIIIPFNLITLSIVTILDIPGLLLLIFLTMI